ncbi:MAG: hypothetical protein ACD_4C00133G0002 [uncultured bacterium (gcode 4)]|uniref:Uncharacterized protein n=1 Tax=uncultured bacterium (gcode 4) TaxID=1234023 RepID=K2G9N1_9BACT|nr:MAG: hypothetical protein ACD_4C00133G0002 [uncultured bacterium (gcode 4)]
MAIDTKWNFQTFDKNFIWATFKSQLDFIPKEIMSEKDKIFLIHSITWNKDFYDSLKDNEESLIEANNIKDWFNREFKALSYSNPEWLIMTEDDKKQMDENDNLKNPNVIFENLKVIIIGNLLRDYISTLWKYKKFDIKNTSTYDRSKWNIDFVMSFEEEEWKKSYIWLASTIIPIELKDHIEKLESRTETFCIEYQKAMNTWKFDMPRLVFTVEPKILFRILKSYYEKIKTDKDIWSLDTYDFMEKAVQDEYVNKQIVNYKVWEISRRIENLLLN